MTKKTKNRPTWEAIRRRTRKRDWIADRLGTPAAKVAQVLVEIDHDGLGERGDAWCLALRLSTWLEDTRAPKELTRFWQAVELMLDHHPDG